MLTSTKLIIICAILFISGVIYACVRYAYVRWKVSNDMLEQDRANYKLLVGRESNIE